MYNGFNMDRAVRSGYDPVYYPRDQKPVYYPQHLNYRDSPFTEEESNRIVEGSVEHEDKIDDNDN